MGDDARLIGAPTGLGAMCIGSPAALPVLASEPITDSTARHTAYNALRGWLLARCTWPAKADVKDAASVLIDWKIDGNRVSGTTLKALCARLRRQHDGYAYLTKTGVSAAAAALIVRGKDAVAIGSVELDTLHLSSVEKPALTATAVHVDAVGSASVATIVGNHAGGAISPSDLAAKMYGKCGYCAARLEDRWRPVVDGNATCDVCYVSQSTIGAQTVELKFDMNVEVISFAAPAGYEATLEAKVAADVRAWEEMRRALAPQNLKVMGNRTQVPFPNKTAKGLTEHQQALWAQTHLGVALASDEKARALHARLDQDVQKLIDLHIGRISAAYDALYPSAAAGSGSLAIGAVEVVDVYGPAPWQFVHNKRVPTGGAQWLLVVAEGGTPTEHLWWKDGVEAAKNHLRSLRKQVLGNDCLDEMAFEEELKTDGDLGAIASAMTSAEDDRVGRRFMYPHTLTPGHLQMFRDANHRGGRVQENKSRTLVIGLAFKHDGVTVVPEAPKQMHGALKLVHLGLNCTVQNSIRLQEQLHGDFITGLDYDFGGGRSRTHWRAQRLVNPAYTTRKAAEGAGPSSSAVPEREGSTKKRSAPSSAQPAPRKQLAIPENGKPARRPSAKTPAEADTTDYKWQSDHPGDMVRKSGLSVADSSQVTFTHSHTFELAAGKSVEWIFAGDDYAVERGVIVAGVLSIYCKDTKTTTEIRTGELIEIRYGLRCTLKSTGNERLRKRYTLIDRGGKELPEHDSKKAVDLPSVTCDGVPGKTCGADVWYESYQVKFNGQTRDLCSACVTKLPANNRAVPKKRRFDKEVI